MEAEGPADLGGAVRWVELRGGSLRVPVRPWTLAQRDELRPLLAGLLSRVQELTAQGKLETLSLHSLFLEAEAELFALVRASVVLPEGEEWGALWYEDLPILAQAVWETSVVRAGGGGLLGKLVGVLSEAFLAAARHAQAPPPGPEAAPGANGSAPP